MYTPHQYAIGENLNAVPLADVMHAVEGANVDDRELRHMR